MRLNDDNQRCSNSILTVRQTNETQPLKKVTCFSSPEFNKVIWTGKRADVFISLSDVSNSFLPAMVWIRVEGKEGRYCL